MVQPASMPASDVAQHREETASVSGAGWDTEDDLTEQLSHHTLNGISSRAASIDSRSTSVQEAKGWGSDDDWGDQEQPQPKLSQKVFPSEGMSFLTSLKRI